jgi:hypothetical protein
MKRLGLYLPFFLALGACIDAGPTEANPETPSFAKVVDEGPMFSDWSVGTAVGPPVTSDDAWQACPFISKDGLELYHRRFVDAPSGDPDDMHWDIFVSQRETVDSPWETPVDLGPNINTLANEFCSFVTIDGHWLYFVSTRSDLGGLGVQDLYVARRMDKDDPAGWGTPKNLGSPINTPAVEHGMVVFEDEKTGDAVLYFSSNRSGNLDIYQAPMIDKETFGPVSPVAELNTPYHDMHGFIRRRDGLEIILSSTRPDPDQVGFYDLYVATRPTTADPWSTPVNLGPDINGPLYDARPSISWDGTTLYYWTMDREPNPEGGWIYYIDVNQATRTKLQN